MFNDILDIKKMIDLIIKDSNGLTHKGLVQEMKYISNHINNKVAQDIAEMERYIDEQADAFERYDDAIVGA
jgi:hypothetical protein